MKKNATSLSFNPFWLLLFAVAFCSMQARAEWPLKNTDPLWRWKPEQGSTGPFRVPEIEKDLFEQCRQNNALTIEAMLRPDTFAQDGPTRILTFSDGPMRRNFTLGQEKDLLILRLRTPQTGENGANPQVTLFRMPTLRTYHLIVAYQPGRLRCWVDGKEVQPDPAIQGDFSNWASGQAFYLGDEKGGNRRWQGRLLAAAVYARALHAAQASAHFQAFQASLPVEKPAPLPEATGSASGKDWPRWGGPAGNHTTAETLVWPPRKSWHKKVGVGGSSPILSAGRVYITGWAGPGNVNDNPMGTDTLYCLNAETGQTLWKQSYPARYQGRLRFRDTDKYGGPLATPLLDVETGLLYTLGVDGDLRCWNARQSGKLLWHFNLHENYTIPQRPNYHAKGSLGDFGMTGSPALWRDQLIVEVGAREGALIAFDKRTGEERWRSEDFTPAGHTAGPVLTSWHGRPALGVLHLEELRVYGLSDPQRGDILARFPWRTWYGCNIPRPVALEAGFLLTSGYNISRTTLLAEGQNGLEEKWSTRRSARVSTPLVWRDRVFVMENRLRCLRLKDGEEIWSGGQFGLGSCLVTGRGRLLAFGRGQLALLDAAAQTYKEVGTLKENFSGECYPQVILAEGKILCKDIDGNIILFNAHQ